MDQPTAPARRKAISRSHLAPRGPMPSTEGTTATSAASNRPRRPSPKHRLRPRLVPTIFHASPSVFNITKSSMDYRGVGAVQREKVIPTARSLTCRSCHPAARQSGSTTQATRPTTQARRCTALSVPVVFVLESSLPNPSLYTVTPSGDRPRWPSSLNEALDDTSIHQDSIRASGGFS